jgi:hypothetical protein
VGGGGGGCPSNAVKHAFKTFSDVIVKHADLFLV